jgi:hypothetical protein
VHSRLARFRCVLTRSGSVVISVGVSRLGIVHALAGRFTALQARRHSIGFARELRIGIFRALSVQFDRYLMGRLAKTLLTRFDALSSVSRGCHFRSPYLRNRFSKHRRRFPDQLTKAPDAHAFSCSGRQGGTVIHRRCPRRVHRRSARTRSSFHHTPPARPLSGLRSFFFLLHGPQSSASVC